jgi:protein-L-isoaspartate(D-aspartate) O-methyltransferase
MTDILELTGVETVLEIGTGSGYQTAVLAEIVSQVYTIEVVSQLHERAKRLLSEELGYTNIWFKCRNGRRGWPEYAPYDRILVTAAPDKLPLQLFDQLKDGGIVVAPIGSYFQKMARYRKVGGKIENESLIGVSFVPLI